jgi:hypothetical protein
MVVEKSKDLLFEYIDNIYTKRFVPEDSEVRSSIWPINRFLSMEKALLETIAYTSRYLFTLGPKYYKLLMRVVPKLNYSPKNKYIKIEKEAEDELLDRYVQYFSLSRKEVKEYLKILFKQYTGEEVYGFVGLETK